MDGRVKVQRTRWILWLLLLLGGTLFAVPVLAAKGSLIADQIWADYENEQLVAKGHVVFTYEEYVITGEEFYLDLEQDRLAVPGWVEIQTEEQTIQGKNLVFFFSDEQGFLEEFVRYAEAETGEPMIFKGQNGEINGDELICTGSSFSGCDAEKPHYHLTAKRMVYYPDDRIEFYQASYWEGKLKFPAVPKLVIGLQDQENDFDESTFGYNAQDGYFLKMVYRYALNGDHQGKLLFDLIQARGVGEGVKHWFPVGTGKDFSLSFYHLDNFYNKHHDYQLQTNWQQEQRLLKYDVGGKYNDLGYPEYGLKGNLNYKAEQWPTSFQFETGQTGAKPQFYLYPCRLNITWQPTRRTRLTYRNNLYYREDLTTEQIITKKYQNDFEFRQSWDLFSLKNFQLTARIKQDYSYSDRYQTPYYHELPAISLSTPAINLGFPGYYQANLDYLRLIEIKGDDGKEGTRTELLLARRPLGRKLWQHGGFSLDLANSNRFQWYQAEGAEYKRQAISVGLTGTERFTPRLTWTNTASWVEAKGEVPTTEFPRLVTSSHLFRPGGHLASTLRYNSTIFTGNLNGGYNFSALINPWYPVQCTLTLTPYPLNSVRLNATYNLNTEEYTQAYLTTRGRYTSDQGNKFILEADYNFLQQHWDRLELETALQFALTAKLSTDVNLRYSVFGDGWEQARLGLTYDWHCRELFFGYDFNRLEYIVQCQYKIFKEAGFGYGSGEQGFMWTGADRWGGQDGLW